MTAFIQHLSDFIAAHPGWAVVVAFFSAAAEAIVVLGAIVPGSLILVALGVLAGTGVLSLWALLIAAALGAVAGDLSAYAIGRRLGDHAANVWPLSAKPDLLDTGKAFFERHGSLSVLIARFVPGIKTIVPALAGILKMPTWRFVPASAASAIVWSPAMILPGAAAGLGLTALGAVSTRLLVLVVAFVVIITVAVLLVRLAVHRILPALGRRYRAAIARAKSRGRLPAGLVRFLDPEHLTAGNVAGWGLVFGGTVIAFVAVVQDVVGGDPLARIDFAMNGLMQSLRTSAGDDVMVIVSSFGDAIVVLTVTVLLAIYLVARRTAYVALAVVAAIAASEAFVALTRIVLRTPAGPDTIGTYSFPSGHVAVVMTLFGIVASLLARSVSATGGFFALALAVLAAALIGLARIYLGAAWTTEAAVGLLLGLSIVAAFNLWFAGSAFRRAQPRRFALIAVAAFLAVGAWHATTSFATTRTQYAISVPTVAITPAEWPVTGWQMLPGERADFQGEAEEPFVVQWAGEPKQLAAALQRTGWMQPPQWRAIAALQYLSVAPALADLPVLPTLDLGVAPVLTLTHAGDAPETRYVLRLWASSLVLEDGAGPVPIYLGSLTRQSAERIGWLTTPREANTEDDELTRLHTDLVGAGLRVTEVPRDQAPPLWLVSAAIPEPAPAPPGATP